MFYPSTAAILVNLQTLIIKDCSKMKTIVDCEEGQEREMPTTLFPQLIKLELKCLPYLTRFCNFTHTIELPLLREIDILGCHSMNAFSLGDVNTPNLSLQGVSGVVSTPNLSLRGVSGNCNINHAIELIQEMAKGWPKKVKHELHKHELELIRRWNYRCDGCEERGNNSIKEKDDRIKEEEEEKEKEKEKEDVDEEEDEKDREEDPQLLVFRSHQRPDTLLLRCIVITVNLKVAEEVLLQEYH
ncbi:hypothetical protein Vadar_023030 [Vaccinium darrowii]|uniref:Uncharacterized protein n=1 Tax=Vaccinium darrowii TaxID=229202 RepID=A0ACB7YXP3_9ERIC|nr:hypothetical protein Vadar_023030 [Vaccinium darrowii]